MNDKMDPCRITTGFTLFEYRTHPILTLDSFYFITGSTYPSIPHDGRSILITTIVKVV